MKKILIISALDIWSMGGNKGAPSLWHTLKGYADNNWKVYFITSNKDKNSVYNVHKNIKIIRFDCPYLKKLFNIKKIGFFVRSVWWLYFQIRAFFIGYQIAKKEKIDIFYGYEVLAIPTTKLLSKVFKKNVVARLQGTILSSAIEKNFWKIRFWQHILALKIPVDLFIVTNDGTQGDKILKLLKVDMNKVKFWVNGVNKDIYIPNFDKNNFKKILGIGADKIILTASRLERWKRVDRIINVMPQIVKKYADVELLIAGDGSERKNLENLVKKLKIKNYIRFLGALSHQELKNYYNLADIFVSMYDISNVGNPLLEAMSCGKCIVTLDVGDTNKFIKNGKNGILLAVNQLQYLPDVIIELLKNKRKRKMLGKNAKTFANKNFWSWEERMNVEIKEIEKLFKIARK